MLVGRRFGLGHGAHIAISALMALALLATSVAFAYNGDDGFGTLFGLCGLLGAWFTGSTASRIAQMLAMHAGCGYCVEHGEHEDDARVR